ncbi:MAG: GNAT family N-acetyltransferase [Actinoplanes sp.]
MPEIRRIREADADAAVELWDRMGREVPDGGPLTEEGRRRIGRMLAIAAWHRNTFCLVAVEGGRLLGFALGRLDDNDGLLPAVVGELQELYAPDGVREQLAAAVIDRLRELGASTLRARVAADDPAGQRFWAGQGFTADIVIMSRYG